jgi:Holliday junction resolvasome RuvABC endonuclease subunit
MILALDPTMNNIGAALFDDDGTLLGVSCIKPDKGLTDPEDKALSMGRQLAEHIKEHKVTDIVAEVTTGKIRNIDAARSLYKAEGGVQMIAGALGIRYHKVSVGDVKDAAVGRRQEVEKDEMIEAALKLKPTPPLSRKKNGEILINKAEHEADAIFVGRAYLQQRAYREAIKNENNG